MAIRKFALFLVCAGLVVVDTLHPAETRGSTPGAPDVPVTSVMALSRNQLSLARKSRLQLADSRTGQTVPVQWESGRPTREGRVVFVMPASRRELPGTKWIISKTNLIPVMEAHRVAGDGQFEILEAGRPVLRYNYSKVEPGAVLEKVSQGNRIYARARSDYIHPLYGLNGELLTRDWSVDHPHHRGIYWAWPEVGYGEELGDLHALQKVFARPTGKVNTQSGPVYAQIEAENEWLWEDREPIVRERALIRVYRATGNGRLVDLAFKFSALKDRITLARRGTDAYGGLNLRLNNPQAQTIVTHTDSFGQSPRRAWSDLSGLFSETAGLSGVVVLQYEQNPDYPGDWVQYPELAWCQPAFPAKGTRYALVRGRPLVLRFRLWIHPGGKPNESDCAEAWDALNRPCAALPLFTN